MGLLVPDLVLEWERTAGTERGEGLLSRTEAAVRFSAKFFAKFLGVSKTARARRRAHGEDTPPLRPRTGADVRWAMDATTDEAIADSGMSSTDSCARTAHAVTVTHVRSVALTIM